MVNVDTAGQTAKHECQRVLGPKQEAVSPVFKAQWLERLQTQVEKTGTKQQSPSGHDRSTHEHITTMPGGTRSRQVTGKGLVSVALLLLW